MSGPVKVDEKRGMQRRIGVCGATMILVGFVIGVSIFILPGTLAASTGPAVVLAYLLASFMALFSCTVAAQVGSVFPVSGASFVAVASLVSPFWGFVVIWMIFGASAVGVALLAFGFADYTQLLWPGLDRKTGALVLVAGLGCLNLLGSRDSVLGQTVMVVLFLAALATFVIAGVTHLERDLLVPFAPNGFSPVLAATIPAFFSFTGFMIIIEMGGEISNPSRNIPLALTISFAAVLVVYSLVSLVLVGIIPWQELSKISAPVGEAALRILPAWLAISITFSAVAAAASSVNALLLGYSRDIYVLARIRLFPGVLANVSRQRGDPTNAVLAMVILSLVAVLAGGNITDYATLAVIGVIILQIAVGVAMLLLPHKHRKRYEESSFRLGRWGLPFFCYGLIIVSLAFLCIAIASSPNTALLAGLFFLVGAAYYFTRRYQLARQGIHLNSLIQRELEYQGGPTSD